jgi:hypothetical protein
MGNKRGGHSVPTVRVISREEAQKTGRVKEPGVRRQRMNEFDAYARALIENPDDAVVYEDIEDDPQHFVLTLRGAFHRAGVQATVRKMRGRNEVRAWIGEPTRKARSTAKAVTPADDIPEIERVPAFAETESVAAPRRGRPRAAVTQ